ncbi:unnamed protein product [Prorocentrum cordatum]|uniref:Solute carrier family 40 protein n=1 Tax=Prorocentrum cordatum TaxID=2364126 RepID=A0ABN9Y738_9DINO|nr:unnamed protein product [Polarella glacialis]
MGTSCAFHGAMALAGPFVVPLPEGCFAHPCLVWPILQDILVVPLQLTALWSKTQSDLRSMAPAAAWATVKTAGAIVMMTVPAYQVYGLGASFAGLVMLSKELCNLDVSASPQAVQDRVMGTGDLLIMGWGTIFLVESLVLTGIAPDETILRIFAVLDLLSKFGPGHLLTK